MGKVISFLKKERLLFLVLFPSLLLRLVNINQSLWHDEAITALAARDYGFKGIISDFMVVDNHSPLYYLLLRVWGITLGFSDTALRLFSVSLGVLTVFASYKLANTIEKNKKVIFLTTLLLTMSAFHVYYSQEVRMYVLSCLLALISAFYYLRIEKIKGGKLTRDHVFFGISMALLMSSDYVPVFFLPVFWAFSIYKKKSRVWWQNFLISHAPLLIFGLLWLPIFLDQIQNYQTVLANLPQWKRVVGGASITQLIIFWMKLILGRISFEKIYYYPLIVIASIPPVVLLIHSLSKKNVFFILWFFVPLTLGLLVSFFFPAFNYFRFLYVVPAFYILLVRGAKNLRKGKMLIYIVLLTNLLGLSIYYIDGSQHREDWKAAVMTIESKAKESNSAIVFNYYLVPAGFRWYSGGNINVITLTDEASLRKLLEEYNSLFYFDYLEDIYDPEKSVKGILELSLYREQEVYDFRNIGFVRYYSR